MQFFSITEIDNSGSHIYPFVCTEAKREVSSIRQNATMYMYTVQNTLINNICNTIMYCFSLGANVLSQPSESDEEQSYQCTVGQYPASQSDKSTLFTSRTEDKLPLYGKAHQARECPLKFPEARRNSHAETRLCVDSNKLFATDGSIHYRVESEVPR